MFCCSGLPSALDRSMVEISDHRMDNENVEELI